MPANGRWDLIRRLKVKSPCWLLIFSALPVVTDLRTSSLMIYSIPFKYTDFSKHVIVQRNSMPFTSQFNRWFFCFWRDSPPVGQGLLFHGVSRSHKTTQHNRQDSSTRGISSSQRPLPDNTQHSQQTSMPPAGFEPIISAGQRPQTYALYLAAAVTGSSINQAIKINNSRGLDISMSSRKRQGKAKQILQSPIEQS